MDVRTCRKCGRLFNYLSGPPVCSACRDEMEKKFTTVKEYIRENPGASMKEIAEENDVPHGKTKQILSVAIDTIRKINKHSEKNKKE